MGKEGSGLSEMLDHFDDEGRGDVGEYLYLFGIVLMGPDWRKVKFDDKVFVLAPGEEGLALCAVAHRANDAVGFYEWLSNHKVNQRIRCIRNKKLIIGPCKS